MFVRNIIDNAKMGDLESVNMLSDRYLYIADRFYDEYSDKISKDKLYDLYDMVIENYLKINYPLSISLYIQNELRAVLKNLFTEDKVLISDYVALAKAGNKEAREFLINHYSYIVTDKAKDYDYLEYEELVQYGMIKLIETIDIQLKICKRALFTEDLIRAINIYFSSTLKNSLSVEEDFLANDYFLYHNELEDKIFEIELNDILNSKQFTEKQRMVAVKHYIEGLSIAQICRLSGSTKQDIHQKVDNVKNKIKCYYNK